MEQDRQNNVKANSIHVDENFDTLLTATNKKLEQDGSVVPTADLPMGSHKITGLATPTVSGDAATKGYVDSALLLKANLASPTFTGTPSAPTPSATDNSTQIATTAFVVSVLETMYPVGSIYIGTQNTCPMGSFFGTWTLVSSGRALWTGNGTNGNGTINAGLPNIKGKFWNGGREAGASGAFYTSAASSSQNRDYSGDQGAKTFNFDASRSSAIYGASTTVQPPAYIVNVWRRTA
jgi:hypothetical protein